MYILSSLFAVSQNHGVRTGLQTQISPYGLPSTLKINLVHILFPWVAYKECKLSVVNPMRSLSSSIFCRMDRCVHKPYKQSSFVEKRSIHRNKKFDYNLLLMRLAGHLIDVK